MLNQCTFIGNLGADPEIRRSQDGRPIANFSLAVTESWRDKNTGERKENTTWVRCVCFSEGLCKVLEQYVRKGSKLYIQGKWQVRTWEKDGQKQYSTECVLQNFDSKLVMLDSRKDSDQEQESNNAVGVGFDPNTSPGRPADLDDEIPF